LGNLKLISWEMGMMVIFLLFAGVDGLLLGQLGKVRASLSQSPSTCGASSIQASTCESATDFSTLPGDPSLILNVNVVMSEKLQFMQAASKAIASSLSKPESYVAVCVNDGLDIIWAGEDTPCALGVLYSIGAINQENNAALTAKLSELLLAHGVPAERIYINFFDVPRANCGWSGRTFAG
jgi:phenylpyruvate tautomerase